jgi:hypothetical protein
MGLIVHISVHRATAEQLLKIVADDGCGGTDVVRLPATVCNLPIICVVTATTCRAPE